MRQEKLNELNKYIEELKTLEELNVRQVSKGFIEVFEAEYKLNNGKTITRDRITKNHKDGSAAIALPVTKDGNVILTIQPRVFSELTVGIEIPAGLVEEGEEPIKAAERELLEETGLRANKYIHLAKCYQDQACSKAISNAYLALECEKIEEQNLDKDEYIKCFECTFEEALELVDMGYIVGAQAQLTLERAKKYLLK